MKKNYLEREFYKMYIEGNVLHVIYKNKTIIDLRVMQNVIKDRLSISSDKSWPIFVDATEAEYWTLEARRYSFTPEALKGILAVAVLSKSHVAVTLVNWVNRCLNFKNPFRLFESKEQAVAWLKEYFPKPLPDLTDLPQDRA